MKLIIYINLVKITIEVERKRIAQEYHTIKGLMIENRIKPITRQFLMDSFYDVF